MVLCTYFRFPSIIFRHQSVSWEKHIPGYSLVAISVPFMCKGVLSYVACYCIITITITTIIIIIIRFLLLVFWHNSQKASYRKKQKLHEKTNHKYKHILTTGSHTLPKRVLETERSGASSFNLQYLLVSLRSCSRCLRYLPCTPVTSIPSSLSPSIIYFKRQFIRKIWPIQLAFLLFILCKIFLFPLTLYNNSSFFTRSIQHIFSVLLQHHISKLLRVQFSELYNAMLQM